MSKAWLRRQAKDQFVKLRAANSYRSRSAFKLAQIDDKFGIFRPKGGIRPQTVVDLGAAPGGWSQVVADKITSAKRQPLILALDLLRIEPIAGVNILQKDFLAPDTPSLLQDLIKAHDAHSNAEGDLTRMVDVVLSDMAPNLSGNRDRDNGIMGELREAIWAFVQTHLRHGESFSEGNSSMGGVLVFKDFQSQESETFRRQILVPNFTQVKFMKPEASRSESREAYFVCMGYRPR